MKYPAILLSALVSGVWAIPQASSVTAAPSAVSVAMSPQQTCLARCDITDVNCKAQCIGGAHPNESQADETTQCARQCDQGSGTTEETDKYAACQQACIASHFPTSQTLGPAQASNAPGKATVTGSAVSGASQTGTFTATGSSSQGSGTSSASASGTEAAKTGAANSNSVQMGAAGLAGLALAIFAL
ncbi:hypothetical protein GQ43DRAFT_438547 [Delitschia confertaspora ATCC 74209]|uniref:HFB protein n=1 Tax=Delitschia confertaspora ATCC 74209 TaxID=1513339 RepID=A0A9P4JST5_9PLEO|nr:hypothetical protein GQ43DRAFT_438547 [Delitschia confertaspora ATCC 74209]